MNVVILAAGKGSRLTPLTDALPKCLVPINNKAALLYQYNFYVPRYAPVLIVIVHSSYKTIIEQFAKANCLSIEVRTHDKADGSANAIYATCKNLAGAYTIFNWCDIIPISPVGLFTENTVITSHIDTRYNYSPERSKLVKSSLQGQGVLGIFHLPFYQPIQAEFGEDFADLNYDYPNSLQLEDYLDFGDLPKYIDALNQSPNLPANLSRLHTVTKVGNKFTKQFSSEKAYLNELAWYSKFNPSLVAKADYSCTTLTLYEAEGISIANANGLLPVLIKELNKLKVGNKTILLETSVQAETADKLANRINALGAVLDQEDKAEAIDLLLDAMELIRHHADVLIEGHFDLNCDNVFVEPVTGKITSIDPRGHWAGKTLGPLSYEVAKAYYGVLYWQHIVHNNCLDLFYNGVELDYTALAGITKLEKAWLIVHLLTGFGVFTANPLKAKIAFKIGLQFAKQI